MRGARWACLSALLGAAALFAFGRVRALYPLPFPRFERLIVSRHGLQDLALLTAGFRRLAADAAWVELLQYTGGEVLPDEDPQRNYDFLKEFTLRVVRIDPHFLRAYVFSAGILAWFRNINRPEEALELLREGMRNNPSSWSLRAMAAAILYKMKDKPESMLAELQEAVAQPECPVAVQSILANIYKDRGEYLKAAAIWEKVLREQDDPGVRKHATDQLRLLARLIKAKRPAAARKR